MTELTMKQIKKSVERARKKHPFFTLRTVSAVSLATEELGEMARAVNDGKREQARAEALDTIAVLVRFLEEL